MVETVLKPLRTVGDLPIEKIGDILVNGGLLLRVGPFVYRLRSPHALVQAGLARMYPGYQLATPADYVDFDLQIAAGAGWRRWIKPQARFVLEGETVFEPLPANHAYALMEWAMNACVSGTAHQYLTVHAAVIERHGFAAVLPAPPGSGKSTLCATLVHAGWRLLSDELTLLSLQGPLDVTPLVRPISLKNRSLEVMAEWVPGGVFSAVTHDTAKGRVGHLRAPQAHVDRMHERALPRWVVFPRWEAGASASLTPRKRSSALLDLARNSFNYAVLGEPGFRRLAAMVDQCDCFDFRYSRLEDAVRLFQGLADAAPALGAAAVPGAAAAQQCPGRAAGSTSDSRGAHHAP